MIFDLKFKKAFMKTKVKSVKSLQFKSATFTLKTDIEMGVSANIAKGMQNTDLNNI